MSENTRKPTPVSVIVLNYNRRSELKDTLKDILAQDYPSLEVIVADNASTDGSREMVQKEFPSVKLVTFAENIGTHARRVAAERAAGDYVVMYDDDSGPSTPTTIRGIADFFDRRSEASVVCTAIYRTRSGYFETWNWESFAVGGDAENGFEGLFLHGSGTAYRREHLLKTSAFDNDLFWGDEEFDAALNLIAHGFRIFYFPRVVTNHRASFTNRNKARFYRVVPRNHLVTFFKYFDTTQALGFFFKEIFYMSLLARTYFPYVLLGVFDALQRLARTKGERVRIPEEFRPYLREVREHRYPGLFAWYRQQQALRKYRKMKDY